MIEGLKFTRDFHPFMAGQSLDLRQMTVLVGDQGAGKSTLIDLIVKYQKPTARIASVRYGDDGRNLNRVRDMDAEVDGFIELLGDLTNFNPVYLDTEKHNPRSGAELTAEYRDEFIVDVRDKALHKIISTMDGYKHSFKDDDMKENINRITDRLLENVGLYFNSRLDQKDFMGGDVTVDRAFSYNLMSHGQTILPILIETVKQPGSVIIVDEPETSLSIRSQIKMTELLMEISKTRQVIVASHCQILMKAAGEVLSLEHNKWMAADKFIETQTTTK